LKTTKNNPLELSILFRTEPLKSVEIKLNLAFLIKYLMPVLVIEKLIKIAMEQRTLNSSY